MTDQTVTQVSQAPVVDAVVNQSAPSVTTVTEVSNPPATIESTVASPPVVEAEAVQPQKTETTVLGLQESVVETPKVEAKTEAPKVEDAKQTDVKTPEAEQKKEEAPKAEEPAQLPTYEDFKLPEGINLDKEKFGEFTGILADIELAKGDHAKMQEAGQKLVDRHIAELQDALKRQTEHYASEWEKQKTAWRDSFVKDPEIGGNRQDTTVKAALQFIRTHGGNDAQQAEFRQLMDSTGLGNHPALIRLLANANITLAEGKPVPAQKPATQPMSKVERRYGKS